MQKSLASLVAPVFALVSLLLAPALAAQTLPERIDEVTKERDKSAAADTGAS